MAWTNVDEFALRLHLAQRLAKGRVPTIEIVNRVLRSIHEENALPYRICSATKLERTKKRYREQKTRRSKP